MGVRRGRTSVEWLRGGGEHIDWLKGSGSTHWLKRGRENRDWWKKCAGKREKGRMCMNIQKGQHTTRLDSPKAHIAPEIPSPRRPASTPRRTRTAGRSTRGKDLHRQLT